MSQSFEFKAEGVIDLIAALPRAASDLARLVVELQRLQTKIDLASREHGAHLDAPKPSSDADADLTRILSAEGGAEFLKQMEADRYQFNLDILVDHESDQTDVQPGRTSRVARSRIMEAALASLTQSAEMMREIVEDTRRDRIEFDIRKRQIDRTLARIDETLESAIGPSQ